MNRRRATCRAPRSRSPSSPPGGLRPAVENGATVVTPRRRPRSRLDRGGCRGRRSARRSIAAARPDAVDRLAAVDARTADARRGGDRPAIELGRPGGAAESYRITADAASVVVTGADAAGLFYGVQTLGQLIAARRRRLDRARASQIEDAPRFAYRGVMLDVARHFHPVETVKAYIDRAAGLKFNALHLHLTDDQGWRIQLDSRPKLTELASGTSVGGDPGGFYTKADYREIVEYAASRHMIVVPEIDMPGHTHAVGLAYPELAEAPVLTDAHRSRSRRRTAARCRPPASPTRAWRSGFSSLKIHDEATYDFVADVVRRARRR